MLVNNITQTITEIPMAGKRGIDIQSIFVNKQEAFQDALTEVFVGQINILRTQLNTFVEQLNTTATQINTDVVIATNAAAIATAKNDEIKNVSVGSTITGMPSTPASVTYSPITGKFTFVIPRGEAFQVDARGAITDRSLYDTMYRGFGFLALDESKIYFKMSNTSGDWSVGLYFGKGDGIVSTVFTSTTHPSGLAGQSGATDTYTINYSNLETDTFIVKNGEDGLDNIIDTVIGVETTWSSTKIKNLLTQKADKVEVDQSIDSLGSTTVKLTDNQTIGGVKTFSSNIVGNITGNASYATSAGSATNATNATNASSVTNGVYTAGNQTIDGVKTFSSSPIVPTPTAGDDSTKVATTAFVKANSGAGGIGVGQTWQNVTSSRRAGVTYTNSTGKPIVVVGMSLTAITTIEASLVVDGIVVATSYETGNISGGMTVWLSAIVPNGSTYKFNSADGRINTFRELR